MLRRVFALLAFALVFSVTARASAAIVRDADRFSIDTSAARICWVSPPELRDAGDCEGLAPDAVPEPAGDDARVIAIGLVRLEEPGEPAELALLMVMHVGLPITAEPDGNAAVQYADGAQKAVAKELREGARMRPATNARLVKTPDHPYPLVRVVLDAEGIPEGADDQLLEHQIHLAGVADDGMYTVAWLSRRRDAQAVEAYADALAPSFTMTHAATPTKELDAKIARAAAMIVLVGILFVAGMITLVVVISRRNEAARYAYPHPYPYHAQASLHPPPAWHPASPQYPTPPRS